MSLNPLKLPPGLERNNSPYDTPDAWWDMSQVRWTSGSMGPVGGWNRLTASPLDSPARSIHVWRDNVASRNVLVGTDAKLYVDASGSYTDITPSAFAGPGTVMPTGGFGTGAFSASTFGTARSSPSPIFSPYGYYSWGNWGEDVILTANTDGRLFYYDVTNPTTAPTVISGAPTGNRAVIVTSERHVMAIGAGADPRQVAWSSRETTTDWNYSSTTNTAGFLNLTARAPLLKGFNVPEGVLVLGYTDAFLLRYLGQPYIYGGTDPIAETSLFNPAAVASFDNGKVVWLGRRGFQLYTGGFVQSLPCPILDDILNGQHDPRRMDPIWGPFRCHASANGRFPEVWFFYPSVGQTECDRYVMWNYVENWWAWGALPRSAMHAADAYQYPYMGGTDGHFYEHEYGWLANGASRVGDVWIETGALSIANGDSTTELTQLQIATGHDYDDVAVTVIGTYTPGGTEYEEGPFYPRDDGYTDARADFRDIRLRFSNAEDGPFAVGMVRVDAKPSGDSR